MTLLKGPLLFIFSGRITIVFSFQMFFIMLLECGMNIITFCGLQKKYYLHHVVKLVIQNYCISGKDFFEIFMQYGMIM